MFEVKILVDDRKLSKVLWLLDGHIVDQPVLRPVRNAQVSEDGTTVVAKNPMLGGVPLTEQLKQMLRANGIKSLKGPTAIRPLIESLGGRPGGYSYYWKNLRQHGIISKQIKNGSYPINFDKLKSQTTLQPQPQPQDQPQDQGHEL